jgi:hypothetical protein
MWLLATDAPRSKSSSFCSTMSLGVNPARASATNNSSACSADAGA